MRAIQALYFRWVFHPHFIFVHMVGLLFGIHLAVASLLAMIHHARRSTPNGRRLPPAGAYDDEVARAIGIAVERDAA